MSYREYFNIDPEYFPQVDKKLIEEKPDLWKKFWPHPTFVQLLKAMVDVLERKQKLSMWVDGAYGTGKSHPNVQSEIDVDKTEFRDYCLIPAMKMRRIIKLQQGFIDTEYKGKDVPFFTVDD